MTWLKTSIDLFLLNSRANTQRLLQYRTDFAVGVAITFFFTLLSPLLQYLLYTRSNGYPGWTWSQILLLQAILLLVGGLRDIFFGDVSKHIQNLMAKGELDQVLLKPFPPLLFVLTSSFSPFSVVTVVVGSGAVVWAYGRSGAPVGPMPVMSFVVFLLAGLTLYLTESVLFCALTVRWTYPLRLRETLQKIIRFGDPPMEVYPPVVRAALSTVLPLAVATYWPAQALLGRLTVVAWISLACTVLLLIGAVRLWNRQLNQYSSAGG
ncbi:ABC-2 family transporter protein [Dactylosporangium roseum]|uniref:ABC-2 family transporter protein n=1 Tax=Dactylosporangium roseum TaxID=47989 RepID=A0ABY5ZBB2_9ACTN|nr:ABC-2 family transporter protein [Dactylosporangium roseum]UWZ39396.1 ABC-2 family transporter protein [Dactylosporangium roseum]